MKKKNKLITLGMVSALLTGIILPAATQVSIVYAAEDTILSNETSTANWPNTGGKTLVGSDYSKVNPLDFNENNVFRKDYSATPRLQNGSELSLYIKGNKTDIGSLPSDGTPGKPKTIMTSQMGEGTYFIASNMMTVLMDGQYQTVDMKVRLLGTDLGTDATSVNFGVKGTEGGGNAFLSSGSGAQVAQRGNFTHMHYQFFKHGTETPVAIKFHMGFTDIDFNEALKIDENVVDQVYIDKRSILPYEIKDGKLAITRDYNDISDKKDPITTPKGQTHVVLFDINAPASGFNISIASSGHNNNDANAITQGSKVAPSILATMLYSGTVTSKYVDEAGNEIAAPQTSSDTIGKDYTTTKSEELTKDGVTYVLVPEKLPKNATGKYVDGNIDVIYIYKKKEDPSSTTETSSTTEPSSTTETSSTTEPSSTTETSSTTEPSSTTETSSTTEP
ncbi:MucBP domain-containing protein, partial [Enterococcus faecalis]